ncbi:MAG: hypothetical protein SPK28_04565 [Bacilli bacterium]|nr:hypothetical protein [Bacilli bacterium]
MMNIRNSKISEKLDILDGLNKCHNELVRLSSMYIKNEIDIVEFVYLINNVKKYIKFGSSYYEDNE